MKDMNSRKANIVSIRMTDEERDEVQRMMDSRNKKASFIMREAFTLFREHWEMSRRMDMPIEH